MDLVAQKMILTKCRDNTNLSNEHLSTWFYLGGGLLRTPIHWYVMVIKTIFY